MSTQETLQKKKLEVGRCITKGLAAQNGHLLQERVKYMAVDVKCFVNCDEQDENGHHTWQLGQFW